MYKKTERNTKGLNLILFNENDTQREACGCVKSIDIGQYNTCKHHCLYCYANFNNKSVENNYLVHAPSSYILKGHLNGDEKITIREMKSIRDTKEYAKQIRLF